MSERSTPLWAHVVHTAGTWATIRLGLWVGLAGVFAYLALRWPWPTTLFY